MNLLKTLTTFVLLLATTLLLVLSLLALGKETNVSAQHLHQSSSIAVNTRDHVNGEIQSGRSAIASSIAETSIISGTYAGTVAITAPVQLGVLDMAFDVGAVGDTLTGTVDLARTLVYTSSSGAPVLHGVVTGTDSLTPTFRLSSETFDGFVSGREVQRRFTLTGEATEGGEILQGTYTEVITGFTPDPMVMEGIFMVTRPPETQDFSALTTIEIKTAVDELWVNESTVVTVTLRDGYRELFTTTTPITLSTNIGNISPTVINISDGHATATFDAGSTPGDANLIVTTGALTHTTSVEVLGYGVAALEISPLPDDLTLPTDGGQKIITATVRDQISQPVSGAVVTFEGSLGTVSPPTATTDANGVVNVTYTAGTMPGEANVVASCDSLFETVTFSLETPEVSEVSLATDALVLQPGASMPITVTLSDQFARPMAGELVSLFGSLGTLTPSSGISNDEGQVNATFTAGSLESEATITALSGYASDSVNIQINAITSPVLQIADNTSVRAGRPASVTLTFLSNNYAIATTAFSVDFDESCLTPIASEITEAVTLDLPAGFDSTVTYDSSDTDGEIDVLIADATAPLESLTDGVVATMAFTTTCYPTAGTSVTAPVVFSDNPVPTFGDTEGQGVTGTSRDGYIEILPAGMPGDANRVYLPLTFKERP